MRVSATSTLGLGLFGRRSRTLARVRSDLSRGQLSRLAPSDAGRAERFLATSRGASVRVRNIDRGISQAQSYETAAAEVASQVLGIIEIATQGASDTLSSSDRTVLEAALQGKLDEIDRIAQNASAFAGLANLTANDTAWADKLAALNLVPKTPIGFSVEPVIDPTQTQAAAETITITAIDASTFSVSGSVSGQFANGTIGVEYTTGDGSNGSGRGIRFTIDSSQTLRAGERISFEISSSGSLALTETLAPAGDSQTSRAVAAGDFDGDGDVDWVESGGDVYLNDGTGGFSQSFVAGMDANGTQLVALDYSGDGNRACDRFQEPFKRPT